MSASGWLRVAFNHGSYAYGIASGTVLTAPLISGSNLIQADVFQEAACGDYIAEYSITIYPGQPPQGGDVQNCSPLELSSLDLNFIAWSDSTVTPLALSLQSGVYAYTLSRTASYGVIQLTATAAVGTAVNVYLNGKLSTSALAAGVTVDLLLNAGTQIIRIDVTQGTCITSYTLTIPDQGSDVVTCSAADASTPVELGGATLSVIDASGNVTPLTITPTWDGLNNFFYVAYLGSVTSGTLSFTPLAISADGWFRISINHGVYLYGGAAGTAITGALIDGSNLIQLDVIQPYACGDYIAEYSVTIYQGPAPTTPTTPPSSGGDVPTSSGVAAPPSSGGDVPPSSGGDVPTTSSGVGAPPSSGGDAPPVSPPAVPSTPVCADMDLTSLTINEIGFGSSTITPLSVDLQAGVYTYTVTRADSAAALQISAGAAAGTTVDVYLNGKILQSNLAAGATIDAILDAGVATLKLMVNGDSGCSESYIITINDNGSGVGTCDAANVQVELGGGTLSLTDASGTVTPLVITPVWDGLNNFFYVAYTGSADATGTLSFIRWM